MDDVGGAVLIVRHGSPRSWERDPGTIYSGSNEIQRNIVGERVLGLPREPRNDTGPWNEDRPLLTASPAGAADGRPGGR